MVITTPGSLKMWSCRTRRESATTTGISASVMAGQMYTATIDAANVSGWWANNPPNYNKVPDPIPVGANVTLNILANGVIVASNTVSGTNFPDQNATNNGPGPASTVTTTWVSSSTYAGESLQLQVICNNWVDAQTNAGAQWQEAIMGITNATLSASPSPEPATLRCWSAACSACWPTLGVVAGHSRLSCLRTVGIGDARPQSRQSDLAHLA